ncbi:hypothetical protein, partial [Flavobacterium columnare]|uniref:hypothetical protein n=1 Tax=Flavobacterium columnare TaxID=996 RepID=UPI001E446529
NVCVEPRLRISLCVISATSGNLCVETHFVLYPSDRGHIRAIGEITSVKTMLKAFVFQKDIQKQLS